MQPRIENPKPLVETNQQSPYFGPHRAEKMLESRFLSERVDMQYFPQERGYRNSCLSSGKLKIID
jgi:hypothetical protein